MAIEDTERDTLDYALWIAREKENPHGLGDYPRRMIVLENKKKEKQENNNERKNSIGSNRRDC